MYAVTTYRGVVHKRAEAFKHAYLLLLQASDGPLDESEYARYVRHCQKGTHKMLNKSQIKAIHVRG